MSEAITDPIPEPAPEPVVLGDLPEPAATSESELTPDPAPTPDLAPKPKQGDRRFAQVTARLATESAAREAAERRAEAAEALLRASRPDETPTPPAPVVDREAEISAVIAQRELNARLSQIDAQGKKNIGADEWENAKATLTAMGATGNAAFLQALAEAEVPEKVFAALADDPDGLDALLKKSPTALAAAVGRMDAKLAAPPPAPVRPLSAAPRPAVPLQPAAVLPEIDPFGAGEDKMSMAEWNAAFEKTETAKRLLSRRPGR